MRRPCAEQSCDRGTGPAGENGLNGTALPVRAAHRQVAYRLWGWVTLVAQQP